MAKRIGAIVTLCLIGIVVAATIIMANIDVSHNIEYKKPNEIWVSYNGSVQTKIQNNAEVEQILKYMDKTTEEGFLSALFNKTLKEKPILKQNRTTAVSIPSTSGYYVIFTYENNQKLEDKGVYYNQLVFTVDNTSGETETKVYVSEDGTMTYRYYYTLNVDYSSVYNYLTELGYNA